MRHCQTCHRPDEAYYDYLQTCTCEANPAKHGMEAHQAHCWRIRHRVVPFRIKLRHYRQTDGHVREDGTLTLPAEEFQYQLKHGFSGRMHSGYLWAEKLLCPFCIQQWEASQAQRRNYLARVEAMKPKDKDTYYQMLARNP